MLTKSYTLTPEQQADVDAHIAKIKADPAYQAIKDIVWVGKGFTDEEMKSFGWDDLEEDEDESTNYTKGETG